MSNWAAAPEEPTTYDSTKSDTIISLVNGSSTATALLIYKYYLYFTVSDCKKQSSIGTRWPYDAISELLFITMLQYDGSNDDLDWRIDLRYLNFIYIIKYLRSGLSKCCFIEQMYLRLTNFNLWLFLIKTLFFKGLTHFIRSGEKIYIVLKKKSAQLDHFYRFYGYLQLTKVMQISIWSKLEIAMTPVKIDRLS